MLLGMTSDILVKRGSLYVSRELYERFFPGLETVVLMRCDDDLLILPVRSAVAGGYMLKRRNSVGDRVVHAAEFLRENGIDDLREVKLVVVWSDARGALESKAAFKLQT
jgi:hypothetical protein